MSFFKEINTFIQQGCVKWIKSDSKDCIVRKYLYFGEMLFFLTFYSSKHQRKKYLCSKKILSSTTVSTFIINQHIKMISEGVMADENSALHHRNKLYFKVY